MGFHILQSFTSRWTITIAQHVTGYCFWGAVFHFFLFFPKFLYREDGEWIFFPNFENGDPKTLSGFVKGPQLSIEVAPHRPALSAMFFPLLMVPLLRLCFLLPKVNITGGHFSKSVLASHIQLLLPWGWQSGNVRLLNQDHACYRGIPQTVKGHCDVASKPLQSCEQGCACSCGAILPSLNVCFSPYPRFYYLTISCTYIMNCSYFCAHPVLLPPLPSSSTGKALQ